MRSSSNANNSGTSRSAGNSNTHASHHYAKMSQQFSQSQLQSKIFAGDTSNHQPSESVNGNQGQHHQLLMNKTTSFLGGAVGMASSMNAQAVMKNGQRENYASNQSHREFGRDITTAAQNTNFSLKGNA